MSQKKPKRPARPPETRAPQGIEAAPAPSRTAWIDTAKAIGIIAVIYGHVVEKVYLTYEIPASLLQYKLLYAFHMPLFFVLSGFLAKQARDRSFAAFARHRFLTRIVPYVFFNILILPFYFMNARIMNEDLDAAQLLSKSLHVLNGRPPYNLITWFLICLLVVEVFNHLLAPLLKRDRLRLCIAMGVFFLAGWFVAGKAAVLDQIPALRDYWYVREALTAYAFFLFGTLLSTFETIRERLPFAVPACVLALACAVLGITFGLNQGPFKAFPVVVFAFGAYGQFGYFVVSAVAGSLAVFALARLMGGFSVLQYLGRNTLILMGLNGIFAQFFNAIIIDELQRLATDSFLPVFTLCSLVTCLTIAVCVPFIYLFTRYMPFAVGLSPTRPAPPTSRMP